MGGEGAEQRIPGRGRQEAELGPARVHASRIGHVAPGGHGQQLGAEAHAQNRDLLLERLLEQLDLGAQEGVVRDARRALAPAQGDHAGDLARRGQRFGVIGVARDHGAARRLQGLTNDSVLAIGEVGDDQGGLHEAAG
jgi:hypothetical protein